MPRTCVVHAAKPVTVSSARSTAFVDPCCARKAHGEMPGELSLTATPLRRPAGGGPRRGVVVVYSPSTHTQTFFREHKDDPSKFYKVFSAPFARQAKFSTKTPVPLLGARGRCSGR